MYIRIYVSSQENYDFLHAINPGDYTLLDVSKLNNAKLFGPISDNCLFIPDCHPDEGYPLKTLESIIMSMMTSDIYYVRISDIIEVVGELGSSFYLCCPIGFRKVDFDPLLCEAMDHRHWYSLPIRKNEEIPGGKRDG